MSRTSARRLAVTAALAALPSLTPAAHADDDVVARVWDQVSGEIRAGWRVVHGANEGRFFQDHPVDDGFRVFDAEVRSEEPASQGDEAPGWFEAEAHGIGDEEQTYGVRGGRRGLFDLSWSYDRDDYSYRATGDAYPYDTTRERTAVRARWTPSKRLTVHLDWDRNLRRGDAWVGADTDIRETPSPAGVDPDLVREHRPLRQQGDRWTLGADAAFDGGFRASISESFRLDQIDDTRLYDVPRDRRSAIPVREALRREIRSPAWTTVAKAGWASPDGGIDVGGIFSWTEQDLDSRVHGSSHGYDGRFDSGGVAPVGAFSGRTWGGNDARRDAYQGRLEGTWRPAKAWEVTGAVEREAIVDDASLRLTQHRHYDRTDVPDEETRSATDARITDRLWRGSLEAAWQVSEDVRLRLGEEYLHEDLFVPTDTRGSDLLPTDFSATSWRTVAGVEWKVRKGLDVSLLVKHATNDDPHAATSAEASDEISYRSRWHVSDELFATVVYRHKGYRQDGAFDSATRSDSVSVGSTWTHGALSVAPTVTYQFLDTRTDTSFYDFSTGSFRSQRGQVGYETRDLIANLDVRYAFAKNLRSFLTVSWINSRGDYQAKWDEGSLGGEYDVSETVTLGAALRSWRLNESRTAVDDYRAVGAEVWVTLRF